MKHFPRKSSKIPSNFPDFISLILFKHLINNYAIYAGININTLIEN